jgi:hypothetical protein
MKKLITITLAVLIGIAFATQKLSTAQEMPVENNSKTYVTNFTVEFTPKPKESYNQFTVCPRDFPTYKQVNERYDYETFNAEGATVFVKHCEKCNIGVYAEHPSEDYKRCTYCGEKELVNN